MKNAKKIFFSENHRIHRIQVRVNAVVMGKNVYTVEFAAPYTTVYIKTEKRRKIGIFRVFTVFTVKMPAP